MTKTELTIRKSTHQHSQKQGLPFPEDITKISSLNLRRMRENCGGLSHDEQIFFTQMKHEGLNLYYFVPEKFKQRIAGKQDPETCVFLYPQQGGIENVPLYGADQNVSFSLQAILPVTAQNYFDGKGQASYSILKIEWASLQRQRPDVVNTLWCSPFLAYFTDTVPKTEINTFSIGRTKVIWFYRHEKCLQAGSPIRKHMRFTNTETGKTTELVFGLKEQLLLGNDILPFISYYLIRILRQLDDSILKKIIKDQDFFHQFLAVFLRSDEWLIHAPHKFLLNASYSSLLVAVLPKKNNLSSLYPQPCLANKFETDLKQLFLQAVRTGMIEEMAELIHMGVFKACFRHTDTTSIEDQHETCFWILVILKAALQSKEKQIFIDLLDKYHLNVDLIKFSKEGINLPEYVFEIRHLEEQLKQMDGLLRFVIVHGTDAEHFEYLLKKDSLRASSPFASLYSDIVSCIIALATPAKLSWLDDDQNNHFQYLIYETYYFWMRLAQKNCPDMLWALLKKYTPRTFDGLTKAVNWHTEVLYPDYYSLLKRVVTDLDIFPLELATFLFNKCLKTNSGFELTTQLHRDNLDQKITLLFLENHNNSKVTMEMVQWGIDHLGIKAQTLYKDSMNKNWNLLASLACAGDYRLLFSYIDKGAPAHFPELAEQNNIQRNPIYYLLLKQELGYVEKLLKNKVPLPYHQGFLFELVNAGVSISTLEFVFKHMGNIKATLASLKNSLYNPLWAAIRKKNADVYHFLKGQGGDMDEPELRTRLVDHANLVPFVYSLGLVDEKKIVTQFSKYYSLVLNEDNDDDLTAEDFAVIQWFISLNIEEMRPEIILLLETLFFQQPLETIKLAEKNNFILGSSLANTYRRRWPSFIYDKISIYKPEELLHIIQWLHKNVHNFVEYLQNGEFYDVIALLLNYKSPNWLPLIKEFLLLISTLEQVEKGKEPLVNKIKANKFSLWLLPFWEELLEAQAAGYEIKSLSGLLFFSNPDISSVYSKYIYPTFRT